MLTLWLSVLCGVGVSAQPTPSEYHVKAAYIYNFANFVTWPADAFESAADAFRVCTFGNGSFGSVLEDTLRNERVAGHPLALVREPASRELRRCHILFVPDGTRGIDAILGTVSGAPVLTVGDTGDFTRRGGAVAFVVEAGRVRFDVNLKPATDGGLVLSSRLLQVARQVQR